MNFKQALIAHLQGEMVEAKKLVGDDEWAPFMSRFGHIDMCYVDSDTAGSSSKFRLAPAQSASMAWKCQRWRVLLLKTEIWSIYQA